jgi:hypothetical protein
MKPNDLRLWWKKCYEKNQNSSTEKNVRGLVFSSLSQKEYP